MTQPWRTFLLLLVSSLLFLSCDTSDRVSQENTGGNAFRKTLHVDGSSTVYPVTEAVAEAFLEKSPKAKITIGISGTGGGFKKFGRGEILIADASRPIKESEIQNCRQNGIDFLELTVAYDGLAVVVNPKNDWVKELTTAELKRIWEPDAQDRIVRWNQVRPEFPDHKMTLLGPGTASGTFDFFTQAIVGESGASRGDYMPSEDDHVLVQGVAGDPYALGFFGLAFFEENQDRLRLVAVDNGAGPVLPTMETVKTGVYQPLSRPLFIYVSREVTGYEEAVHFVEFYLENVSKLAPDVGYVSLPEVEYQAQLEKFRKFVDTERDSG